VLHVGTSWDQKFKYCGTYKTSTNRIRKYPVYCNGITEKGGFVVEHNRSIGEPLPEHFSAKWQDNESLLTD
jgi:hypothetical protein